VSPWPGENGGKGCNDGGRGGKSAKKTLGEKNGKVNRDSTPKKGNATKKSYTRFRKKGKHGGKKQNSSG